MPIQAGALVDVGDFGDTGWSSVALAAGISSPAGYDLSIRRVGIVIYLRGRISGLTADTNVDITGTPLDAMFRPGIPIQDLPMPTNSSSGTLTAVRAIVTSSGVITLRADADTIAYVNTFWIAGDS